MVVVFTPGPSFVKVKAGLVGLVMRLAKALFYQVRDQVGQVKNQVGQGQGLKLDNISDFKTEL